MAASRPAPGAAQAATNATYFNDVSVPALIFTSARSQHGYYYAYSTDGADAGSNFGMYRSADLATWSTSRAACCRQRPRSSGETTGSGRHRGGGPRRDRPGRLGCARAARRDPDDAVEETAARLAAEYERDGRGFVLVRVAGGYRYQTPSRSGAVRRALRARRPARRGSRPPRSRRSRSSPTSSRSRRAQISAIRGVNVDATLSTLVQRGLRRRDRSRPDAGHASFRHHEPFLERLGLDSLDDLPRSATSSPTPGSSRRSNAACAPRRVGPTVLDRRATA